MAVVRENVFLMSSKLRFVKWVRFFERNCKDKWFFWLAFVYSEIFSWKIWNSKKSDDVQCNMWTNINLLNKSPVTFLCFLKMIRILVILFFVKWYVRNNILPFKITQNIRFVVIYILVQNSFFRDCFWPF